jgi:hypothetical protein
MASSCRLLPSPGLLGGQIGARHRKCSVAKASECHTGGMSPMLRSNFVSPHIISSRQSHFAGSSSVLARQSQQRSRGTKRAVRGPVEMVSLHCLCQYLWYDDGGSKELACRAALQLTITNVVVLDVQWLQLQGCNPSPATCSLSICKRNYSNYERTVPVDTSPSKVAVTSTEICKIDTCTLPVGVVRPS